MQGSQGGNKKCGTEVAIEITIQVEFRKKNQHWSKNLSYVEKV